MRKCDRGKTTWDEKDQLKSGEAFDFEREEKRGEDVGSEWL